MARFLPLFLNLKEAVWTCVTLPSSAAGVPQAAAPPLHPELAHPRARPPSQQGPVITILGTIFQAVFPYLWKSWHDSNLLDEDKIGEHSYPQSLGPLKHSGSHHLKRWTQPYVFTSVLQSFNNSRRKVSYLINTMITSCLLLDLRTVM